jgi:hypothetical protein
MGGSTGLFPSVGHVTEMTRGNARRDGAEVSRRRSRWPGVGPLKGSTTRHKEQTLLASPASPTPLGEDAAAAGAHRALKQDEADINDDLLDAVLASDNLARAWKRVKANRGAPGIDGVTVEDFPAHARCHWPAVRGQIEQGRCQPQPVRRIEIPKPDGGKRLLGAAVM